MISDEKQMMRVAMRAELRAMTRESRLAASAAIAQQVWCEIAEWCDEDDLVLGFAPMVSEPDWLGASLGAGVRVAFPRIVGERLEFVVVRDLAELRMGERGVRAPFGGEVVDGKSARVILVPGLAFDRAGGRLGRGGGFYDRVLADLPARVRRIGVVFEMQMVGGVPREAHDERVDSVIGESGVI